MRWRESGVRVPKGAGKTAGLEDHLCNAHAWMAFSSGWNCEQAKHGRVGTELLHFLLFTCYDCVMFGMLEIEFKLEQLCFYFVHQE